ncbi:MAG: hypothetical protein MK212_10650 [Saprospiraceae bacterium]|nr:hypothetical protein [Saprospiraceae bacterium]
MNKFLIASFQLSFPLLILISSLYSCGLNKSKPKPKNIMGYWISTEAQKNLSNDWRRINPSIRIIPSHSKSPELILSFQQQKNSLAVAKEYLYIYTEEANSKNQLIFIPKHNAEYIHDYPFAEIAISNTDEDNALVCFTYMNKDSLNITYQKDTTLQKGFRIEQFIYPKPVEKKYIAEQYSDMVKSFDPNDLYCMVYPTITPDYEQVAWVAEDENYIYELGGGDSYNDQHSFSSKILRISKTDSSFYYWDALWTHSNHNYPRDSTATITPINLIFNINNEATGIVENHVWMFRAVNDKELTFDVISENKKQKLTFSKIDANKDSLKYLDIQEGYVILNPLAGQSIERHPYLVNILDGHFTPACAYFERAYVPKERRVSCALGCSGRWYPNAQYYLSPSKKYILEVDEAIIVIRNASPSFYNLSEYRKGNRIREIAAIPQSQWLQQGNPKLRPILEEAISKKDSL